MHILTLYLCLCVSVYLGLSAEACKPTCSNSKHGCDVFQGQAKLRFDSTKKDFQILLSKKDCIKVRENKLINMFRYRYCMYPKGFYFVKKKTFRKCLRWCRRLESVFRCQLLSKWLVYYHFKLQLFRLLCLSCVRISYIVIMAEG